MKKKDLLLLAGAELISKGKFKLPEYKRSYSESQALERIAKDYGAKNYKEFQNVQREKRFKDYDKRLQRAGIEKDKVYFKDYFGIRKAVKSKKGIKRAYSKVILRIAEKERQLWRTGES
jgi:capsid portal protein